MKHLLPLGLLLLATVVPAPACINDSATTADEQRFVSGYDPKGTPQQKSLVGVERSEFHYGVLLFLLPSVALIGVGVLWIRQERQLAVKRQQQAWQRTKA